MPISSYLPDDDDVGKSTTLVTTVSHYYTVSYISTKGNTHRVKSGRAPNETLPSFSQMCSSPDIDG